MENKEKEGLITRDWLAIERTHLANERTFLAYFRTAIVFLSTAVAIFQIDFLKNLKELGIFLLSLSPLILGVGIMRYRATRRRIGRYYQATTQAPQKQSESI
ncbi:MAG: hypothetical protein OHK0053_37430 [Microscillaceae bacterium]